MKLPRFKRHGWLRIPGVQPDGDRTVEEQMIGLAPALREARGKTVFDIGCAEGVISLAFLDAGASEVYGVDIHAPHLQVAWALSRGRQGVRFDHADLRELGERVPTKRYDIVLALGVIHKLWEPWVGAEYALRSCKGLLCLRPPGGVRNGVMHSKHRPNNLVDFHEMARRYRFTLDRVEESTRDEIVEYWRAS